MDVITKINPKTIPCILISLPLLIASMITSDAQAAPELYFIHNDHLGTPQAVTDQNQNIVWRKHQKPFGETTEETGTQDPQVRFPGQYFDEETGYHYNYFRDYDPTTGRYIQSDPIGLQGGLNTYGYALQNPIAHIDPTGESPAGIAAAAACEIINLADTLSALDTVGDLFDPQLEAVKWQIELLEKRIEAECDNAKKIELLNLLREAQKLLIDIARGKASDASNVTTTGLRNALICAGLARF